MTSAAEYRVFAAECLETLKFATSPEVKAALLLMAERWEKLADYVERASSLKPDTLLDAASPNSVAPDTNGKLPPRNA